MARLRPPPGGCRSFYQPRRFRAGFLTVAFGWSFPKVMVLVTIFFLLFGVPLMAWLIARRQRARQGTGKELRR